MNQTNNSPLAGFLPETKEERIARQAKQHRQLIKEMKLDVAAMYQRKVQHDAYYQNNDNTFTVSEVY